MHGSVALIDFERSWRAAARVRRLTGCGIFVSLLAMILLAGWVGEVDPARLAQGVPRILNYIGKTIPTLRVATLGGDFSEWFWGWRHWLLLLGDTFLIAYVGTVIGGAWGLLLSFPAAANLGAPSPIAWTARRILEIARAVPVLAYALTFVFAFGLGALPGALAVAVHSAGSLGKLFTEMHENAEPGPIEAVRATGASWAQQMSFGVLPQSLPGVLSYGLLRLEINLREAAVLGFVGAGGIGEELYLVVRRFEYQDMSAIIVLILAAMTLLGAASATLRRRVAGTEGLALP